MSNGARSVFTPLTSVAGDALDAAAARAATASSLLVQGVAVASDAELIAALQDLAVDAAALLNVRSQDDFCDLLRAWGNDVVHLAEVVLAPLVPLGVVGAELVEALVIEVLRWKFARLAAILSLGGAIVDRPGLGARFDWQRLRDVLTSTPELVDETFWDDLFAGAGIDDASGRMPALLMALLIVAPRTISALHAGDLRLASLLPPPTSPNASTRWQELRTNSAGWVPITMPLRLVDGKPQLPSFPDLRGSFDPQLAISLLIRSQRRHLGSRNVTDFEMWFHPSVDADAYELRTASGVIIGLDSGVRMGVGYDGSAGTWNAVVEPRDGSSINEAVFRLGREPPEAGAPDLLLGPPYDTRIVARDISLEARLRESGEPSIELIGKLEGFGVVLTNRWFRSLGESLASLREGLRFDLDLEARLAEGAGFSISAEGGLTTRWVIDKGFSFKFLKGRVHSILFNVPIRADEDHFDIRGEVRPHWSATIGPATLVMDGAGGWLGWWADEPGGPKECIGLLPPTGLGFQLDLPGFGAGGFLDYSGAANDRYAGVLTIRVGPPRSMAGWSVTAFGIHELTGLPTDAERKRTFVLVLGATFRPGVHLAFGIFWIGAGGIIGFHRRADTDALRERLTAGAVGNILFAEDPIRNAPILLGDLAALFPARADIYVVGLTMQLGWVPLFGIDYLVRIAIGIIVEFDSGGRFTKVIVLGSLRIAIPNRTDLLDVQVDAVGIFDVVRHTLEVDVTIRRGVVFGLFKVTGDGGLRASWGDSPYMLATLGGFHPDFHPEPAVFPKLNRILLTVDQGWLTDKVELSATAYMAITSNTIQFGAELTAAIKSGNWKIEGKIGGDALIRKPFHFDVSIHGGVHVKYRGHNLIGVSFEGGLSGPAPLVLRGKVCVSLLFFDACWSDSFKLVDADTISGPLLASLIPMLAEELAKATNLNIVDADDTLVLISRHDESERIVVSPLGLPTWSQNRVPLGIAVETFEDARLDTPQRLEVRASVPTTPHLDWFSPGSFVELSEAEAMALPAFERNQAGVVLSLAVTTATGITRDVSYEEIRLPDIRRFHPGFTLPGHLLDRMLAVDAPPAIRAQPPRFGLTDDRFRVESGSGTVLATDVTAVAAHLIQRDRGGATQHVADRRVALAI